MEKNIAVSFDNVSFSYSDVQVLENASFHIHQGEFAAMVGPNGSGKTTVLKLLFGLEKPCKGTINIFDTNKTAGGIPSRKMSRENGLRKSVSYISQQMPSDDMFPITARDVVRMGLLHPFRGYMNTGAAVKEALEQTGISDLAEKPYSSLSGGQKRRALVARALAAKPEFLVLDEPAANMDSESEAQLYRTLGAYKGKITILIVTHNTEYVTSLTDRVLCLGENRKIVQHRTESSSAARHGGSAHDARVLHEENVICNDCNTGVHSGFAVNTEDKINA